MTKDIQQVKCRVWELYTLSIGEGGFRQSIASVLFGSTLPLSSREPLDVKLNIAAQNNNKTKYAMDPGRYLLGKTNENKQARMESLQQHFGGKPPKHHSLTLN